MNMQGLRTIMALSAMAILAPTTGGAFTLREAPPLPEAARYSKSAGAGADFLPPELTSEPARGKSPAKAVMYSLLLPGLGHQYLGDTRRAWEFYVAEGAVWASFAVFEMQGHLRENGYKDFAVTYGDVTQTSHSDDYYRLLTEYDSWQDYAAEIKTDGRFALFPNIDAASLEKYFVENRISDFEPWVWQSTDIRRAYRERRSASKRAYRRGLYAAATGIVTRVASAVMALKAARDYNAGMAGSPYSIEFGPPVYHPADDFQTGVSIVRTF